MELLGVRFCHELDSCSEEKKYIFFVSDSAMSHVHDYQEYVKILTAINLKLKNNLAFYIWFLY